MGGRGYGHARPGISAGALSEAGKKYRKRIEELLERFDSEGSVLYDEYPDRMTLYKMAQDIYAVLEQEEKREQAEAAAVAAAPADGGEVSTTGDRISAGAAMNPAVRTAETAPLLGPESMELIQVLLYGEIFRRRQKKGLSEILSCTEENKALQ